MCGWVCSSRSRVDCLVASSVARLVSGAAAPGADLANSGEARRVRGRGQARLAADPDGCMQPKSSSSPQATPVAAGYARRRRIDTSGSSPVAQRKLRIHTSGHPPKVYCASNICHGNCS